MSERRIAAFDFDGTLTHRDTLVPFLASAVGWKTVARTLPRLGRADVGARRSGGDVHHRDVSKAVLVERLLAGRSAEWLAEAGERYARGLDRRLRPEMVDQVSWHRVQNHELVIVSASLAAYLEPFARDHGFDHVIAVELEADPSGHLTGRLAGPNVRGPEKARRLDQWLGGDRPAHLWAYGNSSGDAELLAAADTPVWVSRYRP